MQTLENLSNAPWELRSISRAETENVVWCLVNEDAVTVLPGFVFISELVRVSVPIVMMKKIVLITGATDGIGKETALNVARAGSTAIVHGRNQQKIDDVVQSILKDSIVVERGGSAHGVCADLSSLKAVEGLAAEVIDRFPTLNVVVSNAAVWTEERSTSKDGIELSFAVNQLAPFHLINRLLPTLLKNAPSRVVIVSSLAHTKYPTGQPQAGMDHSQFSIDWDNIEAKSFDPYLVYALSKLLNVLHCNALSRRSTAILEDGRPAVTFNSLHPGVVDTPLLRGAKHLQPLVPLSIKPSDGAKMSTQLIFDENVSATTGKYFSDGQEAAMNPLAESAENQENLWSISEEYVKRALSAA